MIMISFVIFAFTAGISMGALPIDNSVVGDPKVDCMGEHVGISFSTQKPFTGRMFVRGYAAQKDCAMTGSDRPPAINLSFTSCGIQRSRQLSPPGMIVYTTIIISFHPIFVTKVDRAYRVACHYLEASKTVTADMEVSMLTTAAMSAVPSMPECRYEILIGGPTGSTARYARVGDQIYHKWTCDAKDNAYCMRVHSCTVDDGQGNESYLVVNRQGCATDRFVLQNLEYLTDLMAGQETHVVKFADKATLYFNCQIELLSKASESANCVSVRPNCTDPTGLVTTTSSSSGSQPLLPAPAAFQGDLRRRLARDTINITNQTTAESNVKDEFQVVGDMDFIRQKLTVFDLDDVPPDVDPAAKRLVDQHSLPTRPTSNPDRYGSKIETNTLIGPVCISPLGFGFALFGLLTIFIIALSTAIKYALPSARNKYDLRNTMIRPDYNIHHLGFHEN